MKKIISALIVLTTIFSASQAQLSRHQLFIPEKVRHAFSEKYPSATNVTWEKEKGNYEGNWGGKSGEDNSVQFAPDGTFVEIAKAIPVSHLPEAIKKYIAVHFKKNSRVTEASEVTDASEKKFYEAEVNGKDIRFDKDGMFVGPEK